MHLGGWSNLSMVLRHSHVNVQHASASIAAIGAQPKPTLGDDGPHLWCSWSTTGGINMVSRHSRKSFVLKAEPGQHKISGNAASFALTDAEVTAISSSANSEFEAAALEFSKRIEEIAKTVSDSE
jgi:hypothetical protein